MTDHTPQWRGMDAQTRADAYSPSKALSDGDLMPFIRAYIAESAAAYAANPSVKTLEYGAKPANTLDIVIPKANGPVPLHVFIHGGYWQELSKKESFFLASQTVQQGIAFATLDYTLAPEASLDEIVAECTEALVFLIDAASDLGIDPARIIVSGSSAGAHLAAMCSLKLPADKQPSGVVLVSGVYDLEPLIGTYVNDALNLDLAAAQRNSPALATLATFPKAIIAWGGHETDEFKRQSRHFAELLSAAGRSAEMIEMTPRNHFDIVFDLANDSTLGRKTTALAIG